MVNSEDAVKYIKDNLLKLIDEGKLVAETIQSQDTISFYVYKTPTVKIPLLTLRTSDHRPILQKYINSQSPHPSEKTDTNLSIEFYKPKFDDNGNKVRNRMNTGVSIPVGVDAPKPFTVSSYSYKPQYLDTDDIEKIYQSVLQWIFNEERKPYEDPFKGTEKEASVMKKEAIIKDRNKQTNENNNDIKTENYMRNNKRIIRLTESDLHRVIKESVRKILKEEYEPYDWDGLDNDRKEFEKHLSWRNKEEVDANDRAITNPLSYMNKQDYDRVGQMIRANGTSKPGAKMSWDWGYKSGRGVEDPTDTSLSDFERADDEFINPYDYSRYSKEYALGDEFWESKKRVLRLTESDLHRVIEESVKISLNEIWDTGWGDKLEPGMFVHFVEPDLTSGCFTIVKIERDEKNGILYAIGDNGFEVPTVFCEPCKKP